MPRRDTAVPGQAGSARQGRGRGAAGGSQPLNTPEQTGRLTEAARLGLINGVVEDDELLEQAVALAQELATKPPLALTAALAAFHRGMDASIDDGLALEEAASARIVPAHDTQAGIAAFLAKRQPTFTGK